VRLSPKNVGFWRQGGHSPDITVCRLVTQSGYADGRLNWESPHFEKLALAETTNLNEIPVPATSLQAAGFRAYAVIAACFSRLRTRMVRAISAETVLFAHTKTGAVLSTTATGGSRVMRFRN
jgi:hypothetical protein